MNNKNRLSGEYMKKATVLIVLVFWTSLCQADVCQERMFRMVSPVFPGTLNAVHTLRNEKLCAIDVAYAVNSDGRAENIVSRAEREICTGFKISAMRAIRYSQFAQGEYLNLCYVRVIFRLEDGEMKTEYTRVPDYVMGTPPSTGH
jgi:hypothetical protein